jgi:anaerobic magnesium-protoporphyrin IX monomethyl ester cyclase
MKLGEYFETHSDFHRHDLSDVYQLLYEFCCGSYPDDSVLLQLVAVDYYLQHKIKPKSIFPDEINSSLKNKIIEEKKLDHHKYRFVMIPLSFEWKIFLDQLQIQKNAEVLIIQFSGKEEPVVLDSLPCIYDKVGE